jgi:NADH-quinone oxidoreductase subunit J
MPSSGLIAFTVLATLTLGSAGFVAFSKDIIHSTLALLGTFIGVAGLYVTLSADFLAATQILVYVGGTLTLILFAVMLTSRLNKTRTSNPSTALTAAFGLVALVLLILGRVIAVTEWPSAAEPVMPSTARIGHAFLSVFLLPFELVSILLLGALIGAVVLARRSVKRAWEDG